MKSQKEQIRDVVIRNALLTVQHKEVRAAVWYSVYDHIQLEATLGIASNICDPIRAEAHAKRTL